jgi:COP9 signalosome complex subunit 1
LVCRIDYSCRNESFLTAVKGRTRIDRLLLIGTSSTYLYLEALKAAISEAKRGRDISQYERAVSALRDIVANDPDATIDLAWVDRVKKQVKSETDKMELELKGYKNNLIKESIRVCSSHLSRRSSS